MNEMSLRGWFFQSALTLFYPLITEPIRWVVTESHAHAAQPDGRGSQAVFLQMPLVILQRARNVRVLVNIEHTKSRENVVTAEFIVGSDGEKQIGRPLAAE
jgi:hypothetical protein